MSYWIYQIEYQVDITTTTLVTKTLIRETLGLKGNFGTLKLGTHDTIEVFN